MSLDTGAPVPDPSGEQFEEDLARLDRVELAYGRLPRTELVRIGRKYGRSPETVAGWRRGRQPKPPRGYLFTDTVLETVAFWGDVKEAWRERRQKGEIGVGYHTFFRAWKRQVDPAVRVGVMKTAKEARKHQIFGRYPVGGRTSMYQADGTMADTYVWSPRHGKAIRPWHDIVESPSTAFAWMTIMDGPSDSEAVVATFAEATLGRIMPDGTFVGGIAGVWKTDRGRDYIAKDTRDVAARLGAIQVVCDPYAPYQKGPVESALGIIIPRLAAQLPGRVRRVAFGQQKPWHEEDGPLLTFEEYCERAFPELDWYLTERIHQRLGMTPLEAWKASSDPIHRVTSETEENLARLFLRKSETRIVSKNGIRFRNREYWNVALLRVVGEEVVLGYSQNDPSFLHVFRGEEYICKAIPAYDATPKDGGELRRARRKQERIIAKAHRGAARRRAANGSSDQEPQYATRGRQRTEAKPRTSGRARVRGTFKTEPTQKES